MFRVRRLSAGDFNAVEDLSYLRWKKFPQVTSFECLTARALAAKARPRSDRLPAASFPESGSGQRPAEMFWVAEFVAANAPHPTTTAVASHGNGYRDTHPPTQRLIAFPSMLDQLCTCVRYQVVGCKRFLDDDNKLKLHLSCRCHCSQVHNSLRHSARPTKTTPIFPAHSPQCVAPPTRA